MTIENDIAARIRNSLGEAHGDCPSALRAEPRAAVGVFGEEGVTYRVISSR